MWRIGFIICLIGNIVWSADHPTKLISDPTQLKDPRLGKPIDYNGYFPFRVPKNLEAWEKRKADLKLQMQVALGLWPMPAKTPLNPVIRGKIERRGYTIEHVHFESLPGHFVTGNLYRPTGEKKGKYPAILSPHGHWSPEGPGGGRLQQISKEKAEQELKIKAEDRLDGAQYPLQARCANLAMMGFVVFHYDMVGYADSQAIKHRTSFTDVDAELRLQNFMGLQTWNSIRALDFLTDLADVDPQRIGVTGASGGGTQTFILCALDDRPAVAFPAVMVSTGMQGGCVCENASYLRIGTSNVEMAAMFAPKPLAMSAANDWTKEMETKGFPELQQLYEMYGKKEHVQLQAWLQFGHNYNQHARESMYSWFNKHLLKKDQVVKEQPFVPVSPAELQVFTTKTARPKTEVDATGVRKVLTAWNDQVVGTIPLEESKKFERYQHVLQNGWKVLLGGELPPSGTLDIKIPPKSVNLADETMMHVAGLGRKGSNELTLSAGVFSKAFRGEKVCIILHPDGKKALFAEDKLQPIYQKMVAAGYAVLSPDVIQTGELVSSKPFPINKQFAGYTYGYNQPLLAQRVQDVLNMLVFSRDILKAKEITLVGFGEVGLWALGARALAPDLISETIVDLGDFHFAKINDFTHPAMLPGAVKYGDVTGMILAGKFGKLTIHRDPAKQSLTSVANAFERFQKKENLILADFPIKEKELADRLLR